MKIDFHTHYMHLWHMVE